MQNHEYYFHLASLEAVKATCTRGKCGAVIVKDGAVIGSGFNSPPQHVEENCKCNLDYRESIKPKSDRTCCMHAEWRAIIDTLQKGHDLVGSTLYFIRVDDEDNMKYSGNPYCTVCSRLALDTGISYFGLWQEAGPRIFDAKDYNDRSYDFHKGELQK